MSMKKRFMSVLSVVAALVLLASVLAVGFPSLAETDLAGWVSINGTDFITQNGDGSITVDTMNSENEFLYLNHENSSADNRNYFGTDMKDFTVEFDMSVLDYLNKATVDGGDLGAGSGAISLAFMGLRNDSLENDAITARIDYQNLGFMWRSYAEIANPYESTWSYVDGQITSWHWRLNSAETCHVKVVKSGYTLTMDVANGQYTHTVTLPSNIGLPESGYIGLMFNGVEVTISNVKVVNGTTGATMTAFAAEGNGITPPAGAGKLYDGWTAVSPTGADFVTENGDGSITVNTMNSENEFLYLNHENSSADNRNYFGTNMKNFTVEFDMSVLNYLNKAAVDGGDLGAGGGAISLAFLGLRNDKLDNDSITARIDYQNLGFMWRNYAEIANPYESTWSYVDGKYSQWHWRLNSAEICHVKVVKSGYTLTMDVANGQYVHTVTLPSDIGLPKSGYIGLMFNGVEVTISNMKVTNDSTLASVTAFTEGEEELVPPTGTEPDDGDQPGGETPPPSEPDWEGDQTGKLYEGWQHISCDVDSPKNPDSYISYDEETGKLTFNALNSDNEMLFLNTETSGAELLEKFPVNMMEDFTVEYDIKLDATAPGGGEISFCFMGIDGKNLWNGCINAGHTNDHNCFWWRGYPEIEMPGEYSWAVVGWPDAFLDPSFKGTGRTFRVVVSKSGWTISMSVNDSFPIEVDLHDDIGLPESGYMGFLARQATGSISNVIVTNDTTGETMTFFGDGESDADDGDVIVGPEESVIDPNKTFKDLEGWSAFCYTNTDIVSHYYQRDDKGALFFDGMDCMADLIYLNADYTTSDAGKENRELFGKDAMQNYTIDFDFCVRDLMSEQGGSLTFFIQTANQQNPGYSAIALQFNGSATGLKYEYADVGEYGLLENTNPTNPMISGDMHHVTIEKVGRILNIYIDGFEAWLDVPIPETVGNDLMSQLVEDSGYIGFWSRYAKGYVANVTVTNDTTGATKTFFEDFGDTIDFWEVGGGDTTNLMALTPEKGVGVYGVNTGETPDNTMIKYVLPLDMNELSFTFVPKKFTTTDFDDGAWMGFALTDSEKDYNPNNCAKSSGFVAQIGANPDGSATVTFVSMLPDGDFGDHTTTATIASYQVNGEYLFSFKNTAGGVEVYLDGEKLATLDWLTGVYNSKNYCYLTTTASCTDGFEQAWAVTTLNGENAVDYDSGLFEDGDEDVPGSDDNTGDDNTGDDNTGDDNTGDGSEDSDSPVTGDNTVFVLVAAVLLLASAVAVRKLRRA